MIHDPKKTKKLAKDSFESWAGHYDRSLLNYFLFRPSYHAFLEELARWQQVSGRPLDLLDIGCGTGTLVAMVAGSNLQAGRLIGLDYAHQMCVQAATKVDAALDRDHMRFINGDSEHLPFADESFDVVTCGNSFHHYPHQQAVVCEMRRLLRPGGQLMIIDGFRDNVVGWVVFDVIITAVEKAVYHVPWKEMRAHFEKAGFSDIRQRKMNFLFPVLLTVGQVDTDPSTQVVGRAVNQEPAFSGT